MNGKLVLFLICIVIGFVFFVGKDVFTSLARKNDSTKLNTIVEDGYDGPSKVAVDRLNLIKGFREIKHKNSLLTGATRSEKIYLKALDNLLLEKKRLKERQESRHITKFLKTEAGQLLDSGLEKLKLGHKAEAREYILQALDMHMNFDPAIYMIFLKTLIHAYVGDEDKKQIDQAVLKYLALIKQEYSNDELAEYVNELVDKIEEKIND